MDDEVERGIAEELVKGVGIEEVDFVESRFLAGDLLDFIQDCELAV